MADAAVQAALKKEAAAGCAFFVFLPRTKSAPMVLKAAPEQRFTCVEKRMQRG